MRISDWSSDVCSSDLANAPFIKIEATKFTEVGYVGRDVDTIIRDLVEISVKQSRDVQMRRVRAQAEDAAEDRILDVLISPARDAQGEPVREENNARQTFRKRLRERSEEHTSELQSLMRSSYAVFCLKKKKTTQNKS